MLLGVYTGLHDEIAVQDLGIDNVTAADGLAVGRVGFVGRAMETSARRVLYPFKSKHVRHARLAAQERIRLEPSALAGMAGPLRVQADANVTHRVGDRRRHGAGRRRWRSIWRKGSNYAGWRLRRLHRPTEMHNLLNVGYRKQQ